MSATNPNFANGPPILNLSSSSTAQTATSGLTSGSTGITQAASGVATGLRLDRVRVSAPGAAGIVQAALVNWFLSQNNGGALSYLCSTAVSATTGNTTAEPFNTLEGRLFGLSLPGSGYSLYWSTTIAQLTNVEVEGASY